MTEVPKSPPLDYANWFRETTPYISAHRGRTFVVSLPGEALTHPNLTNVVHDLALLNVIGVRLVIVHGARPQLDAALGPTRPDAWRITTEAQLPIVTSELARLRALLESRFSAGLPGSPLHNTAINVVSGNFVLARPVGVREGQDHQFTGQVRSLKTDAINAVLNGGAIVLLSPCGISPAGQLYNLSAEELAAETAVALGADKLITFAEDAYITDQSGTALPELTPGQLDAVLEEMPAADPGRRRLGAMLSACRRGVPRCPQVSYATDGALLGELFTADGQGSQLSEEAYRNVRSATVNDLAAIVALIRPLEQAGLLVRRSRDQLEADIEHFRVAEVDNRVVGCCALYTFDDPVRPMLELACLAAHQGQRHSRVPVGDQLLAAAEDATRSAGLSELFVLTTAAQDWFIERGFKTVAIDSLPQVRRASYDGARGSHALVKAITHQEQRNE